MVPLLGALLRAKERTLPPKTNENTIGITNAAIAVPRSANVFFKTAFGFISIYQIVPVKL